MNFIEVTKRFLGVDDLHVRRNLSKAALTCYPLQTDFGERPATTFNSRELFRPSAILAAGKTLVDLQCKFGELHLGRFWPSLDKSQCILEYFRGHRAGYSTSTPFLQWRPRSCIVGGPINALCRVQILGRFTGNGGLAYPP